jgi:hypothetical protein
VNSSSVISNIRSDSGQARGRIPDSGAIKKLAVFFIRNLVKLVKLSLQLKFPNELSRSNLVALISFSLPIQATDVEFSGKVKAR